MDSHRFFESGHWSRAS